jgi:hypothetical protein
MTELLGWAILLVLVYLGGKMAGVPEAIARVLAATTAIETKADSLITLVNGIATLLRENAADPVEINAIADRLDAQTAEIQAALDANITP